MKKSLDVQYGNPIVYFNFDNPHRLPITKAKAIIYKKYKPYYGALLRMSGNMAIFDMPKSLVPGDYILVASGYVGSKLESNRMIMKVKRTAALPRAGSPLGGPSGIRG